MGTRRLRGAPIVGSLAERGWELRWRVALAGLVAMALAVVSAQPAQGATFQVAVMNCTFHGEISAHTPTGWNSV